jgi:hypothetical protein
MSALWIDICRLMTGRESDPRLLLLRKVPLHMYPTGFLHFGRDDTVVHVRQVVLT